eukprot:369722-Amphidinium_carterae.2
MQAAMIAMRVMFIRWRACFLEIAMTRKSEPAGQRAQMVAYRWYRVGKRCSQMRHRHPWHTTSVKSTLPLHG